MKCEICGSDNTKIIGKSHISLPNGVLENDIYKCFNCGSYFRGEMFETKLVDHFYVTSYTDLSRENELREKRRRFFENILKIALKEIKSGKKDGLKMLDVGCSYGHLMEIASGFGIKSDGVEVNDILRGKLIKMGYRVFKSIYEINSEKYDLIFFIDSLYYFDSPVKALKKSRELLKDNGVIVIRLTNRTLYLKLYELYRKLLGDRSVNFPYKLFGDAKWNFSLKGVKLSFDKAGLKITRKIFYEKGKSVDGFTKKIAYKVGGVLSTITPLKISPGVIVVASKKEAYTREQF